MLSVPLCKFGLGLAYLINSFVSMTINNKRNHRNHLPGANNLKFRNVPYSAQTFLLQAQNHTSAHLLEFRLRGVVESPVLVAFSARSRPYGYIAPDRCQTRRLITSPAPIVSIL